MEDTDLISHTLAQFSEFQKKFFEGQGSKIRGAAFATALAAARGSRIFLYGNCQGITFSNYLFGSFIGDSIQNLPPLPVISLNHGSGNGEGDFLERQIFSLGMPGDILIIFSGNLSFLESGLEAAIARQMIIICFTLEEEKQGSGGYWISIEPGPMADVGNILFFLAVELYSRLVKFYLYEEPGKVSKILLEKAQELTCPSLNMNVVSAHTNLKNW